MMAGFDVLGAQGPATEEEILNRLLSTKPG